MLNSGDTRFRVANMPRLEAKLTAVHKLDQVSDELGHLVDPVGQALAELATRRAQLARILDADADHDLGGAASALMPLDNAGAQGLLATWEQRLQVARDAAMAARRRVILAVHHALLLFLDENVFVGEDVHDTILRLAPELHSRIFGNARNVDPCAEPLLHDSVWDRRKKRTDVSLMLLMREVGREMRPWQFVYFSLIRSRREFVECEGDLARQELRLRVMRSVQDAVEALAALQMLNDEFQVHLTRPSLLGNQVNPGDEVLPMHSAFYPCFAMLSEDELYERVRHLTSVGWDEIV